MFDFPTSNRSQARSNPLEDYNDRTDRLDPLDRLPIAWFALCIGNTRSHWAYIEGDHIRTTWDAPHLDAHDFDAHDLDRTILYDLYNHIPADYKNSQPQNSQPQNSQPQPLIVLASVVPSQTELWRTGLDRRAYPYHILQLADIPLSGLYATLGIDRALAGLGIGQRLGFPCLAIDGGTALTFTGFASLSPSALTQKEDHTPHTPHTPTGSLIGGAILPGMGLQYRSLGRQTEQLSELYSTCNPIPKPPQCQIERWARDTPGAIDSGIHRAIGAIAWDFIVDWRRRYPDAIVAITGGDAIAIETAIMQHVHERDGRPLSEPERTRTLVVPEAIMWGMIATLKAIPETSFSG